MVGFYELTCIDSNKIFTYYYFHSPKAIRHIRYVLENNYAPAGLRLVLFFRKENNQLVRLRIMNPFEYFYKKYIKNSWTSTTGYRVDWERIFKESVDKIKSI
jgi:hypothetical protein